MAARPLIIPQLHASNAPECDQFRIHRTGLCRSFKYPWRALLAAKPIVVKDDYVKWMLEDPRVNLAISARHILQLVCGNFIALLNDLSNVMEVNCVRLFGRPKLSTMTSSSVCL
jgi:hypothetical protein